MELPIYKDCGTEEAWLEERLKGIGGSDAGAILGISPYKTKDQLKMEKRGLKTDPKTSSAIVRGKLLEQPLKYLFLKDFPKYQDRKKMKAHDILISSEYGFLRGTPDMELVYKERINSKESRLGFLEIKTTSMYNEEVEGKWKERIPESYYVQMLHYFILNPEYQFGICYAMLTYPNESDGMHQSLLKAYRITREEKKEDIEILYNKLLAFWDELQEDIRNGR
jgi:putative phage-type endonuclease